MYMDFSIYIFETSLPLFYHIIQISSIILLLLQGFRFNFFIYAFL
ncbi:hypothetical protein ROSINTL182_05808 [Roseburia intestinalis L1-82]|uniref:Uncharacterized protein n=1 Tax=Roseburia intestinalis L1-82 TaxID=536231 RepID=C7G7E2_9FIRM|nr:hypothetical protein ROSINTL182_05808 [Roseburia intestinalis L1-82]